MMDIKRARTRKQKQQRLQAILQAADKLLDQYDYKAITMAMIADELGFSRANLIHYVETKEEIFLLLHIQDTEKLLERLMQLVQTGGPMEIEAFAEVFAQICTEHHNFCRIGAMLYTIIETNIPVPKLAEYKRQMHLYMDKAAQLVPLLLPFLSVENAGKLIYSMTLYLVGLYPSTHLNAVQQEAMKLSGLLVPQQDFCATLREYLMIQLYGYKFLY